MPISLLPASAAAFAPRSAPNVVLNTKVEQWLTQTLKRINKVKRPLNSVPQHVRCLTETLSGTNAIWTLCSIMLPKAPDSELRKDPNPLVEGLFNYQLIHIEAYVVHVDMVSQHEVAFKLNPETIEALIEYHKDIYSVDVSANTWNWAEKEVQLKKLHEEFVQAVNRFVFRTGVRALEGLEEEGAGELLDGRSDDVKTAIMGLFLPLLPPPPRIVDVVRQPPLVPSSTDAGWWPSTQVVSPAPHAPVESWKVLPSTPSPTVTNCSDSQPASTHWNQIFDEIDQLPSPTPSFSQAYCTSGQYYSPPQAPAPIPAVFPSMLTQQQCGASASNPGFGGFGWSSDLMPQYAAIM